MQKSDISVFDFLEMYNLEHGVDGYDFIQRKIGISDEEIITVNQYISTHLTKIENFNNSIIEWIQKSSISKFSKREIIQKIHTGFKNFKPR